ncbi:MAG: hypothetical protein GY810_26195 [Aureispira sp.]|nr:hypothetical protein [Aureispira sp.]
MALLTRSTLKNLFKRGSVPSEVNFSDLIDSTVNKVDDGFSQSSHHGFMLAPQGPNRKLISFFESIRDPKAAFSVSMNPNSYSQGLSFNDMEEDSVLFLKQGGNVGVGTTTPQFRLEVNGMAGMKGRVGTYASGEVKANGDWQTIIEDLEGLHAFEIIAQAGAREGRGRYAMTCATALCNYGQGTLKQLKSTYRPVTGFMFDRIKFRWDKDKDTGVYKLQVKTASNYGYMDEEGKRPAMIRFYASKLWDHTMMRQEKK